MSKSGCPSTICIRMSAYSSRSLYSYIIALHPSFSHTIGTDSNRFSCCCFCNFTNRYRILVLFAISRSSSRASTNRNTTYRICIIIPPVRCQRMNHSRLLHHQRCQHSCYDNFLFPCCILSNLRYNDIALF